MKITENLVVYAGNLCNRYIYVLKGLSANVCIIIAPSLLLAFTFILIDPIPLLVNVMIEFPH